MVNAQYLSASSAFFGFKNYRFSQTSGTIPGQAISAGGYVTTQMTIPLGNVGAVSCVKIKYSTIESFWRQMQGSVNSGLSAADYTLQSNAYYSSGNLVIDTYAVDQTGLGTVLPAQTLDVQARLYKSPFSVL